MSIAHLILCVESGQPTIALKQPVISNADRQPLVAYQLASFRDLENEVAELKQRLDDLVEEARKNPHIPR
jgi:hypothetical protein